MKPTPFLIALVICVQSCKIHLDLEKEKASLLEVHKRQQKAHLEKDVSLLLADISSNYIEINRGRIKTPARQESFERFTNYFDQVDFIKWEDASPPVFDISGDGSMATSVVDKLVITKDRSNDRQDTVHYAWLAVYKKENGEWKLQKLASTDR